MPISLHIEAANFEELMGMIGALTAPAPAGATRGRRSTKEGAPAAETGAALPGTGNGTLPAGMDAPQPAGAAADDMFGDAPVAQAMKPTAATPQPMTQEQFLAAMRGLLGKGKDDAVRAKVAAMGYAKVRDVPTEKMAEVYAAAQQV